MALSQLSTCEPPSKVAKLGFQSKEMDSVLKPMKKQFSDF